MQFFEGQVRVTGGAMDVNVTGGGVQTTDADVKNAVDAVAAAVEAAQTSSDGKLDQVNTNLATLATQTKLEAVRVLLASIDGKDFATNTKLEQVRVLLSSLDGKDYATQTTLAAAKATLDQIYASVDGVEALLTTLSNKDFATQVTLAQVKGALDNIYARQSTDPSTGSKQDTGNTALATLNTNVGAQADGAATSDTGSFSLISLTKRLLDKLTTNFGDKITAATMPTGGAGLLGWLSAIYQQLAGGTTTTVLGRGYNLIGAVNINACPMHYTYHVDPNGRPRKNITPPSTAFEWMHPAIYPIPGSAGQLAVVKECLLHSDSTKDNAVRICEHVALASWNKTTGFAQITPAAGTARDANEWFMDVEVETTEQFSATATVTVTYTNQDGVANRTAQAITIPSGAGNYHTFQVVVQSGDLGIRSVEGISVTGGSFTTGVFKVVGHKTIKSNISLNQGASSGITKDGLGQPDIGLVCGDPNRAMAVEYAQADNSAAYVWGWWTVAVYTQSTY